MANAVLKNATTNATSSSELVENRQGHGPPKLSILSITDLTVLPLGSILNSAILIAILSKRRLHNPVGCYVLSMTILSFAILLIVVGNVLRKWFHIESEFHNYRNGLIMRVCLHSYSLTLVTLALDRFIAFCRMDSVWHATAARAVTAVKAVLLIWFFASVVSVLEFHLDNCIMMKNFRSVFYWSTGICLVFPTIIIVGLELMIAFELFENRQVIYTKWSSEDLESVRLLITLTIGYYVTMVPVWITLMILYNYPQFCCLKETVATIFSIFKFSAVTIPLSCIATLKNLRRSLLVGQNTMVSPLI